MLMIPEVGTEVLLNSKEDIKKQSDGKFYTILQPTQNGTWEVSSKVRGMRVILREAPEPSHNAIRITSIINTGKGAYGESFKSPSSPRKGKD